MDPITHGLIGATASQSFAKKVQLRAAAFTGFASAMLADLDVFITDSTDPLLNLELHRQFTHSLIFIPFGALIGTVLVWWLVRKHLTFKETYLFSLAAYATAGIADTFTSYGVQLLWPFLDKRYAWNIISVFDPLFTLGIILCLGMAIYKRRILFSWIAGIWILLYLFLGFIQHQRTENVARQIAVHYNQTIDQLVVKPTIANQLLWSIRIVSQDSLYAYGVHLSPFSEARIYKGESKSLLNWQEIYSDYKSTTFYTDIQRFSNLSDGFLIKHPQYDNVIGDGRYSMLPTTLSPLWGIEVDTTRPNQHVKFGTYRDAGPDVRKSFLDMLLGRKVQ